MEPIEIWKKEDEEIRVYQDEDYESPREWDDFSVMICFHPRYELGDKHDLKREDFSTLEELKDFLVKERKAVIIMALNIYDHSGISMSTSGSYPYNDRWDSSIVGFIYATKEAIIKEFGKYNKVTIEKARTFIEEQVKTYSQYLEGDVWAYDRIKKVKCEKCGHVEEENIEGCGGFFGGIDLKKPYILMTPDEKARADSFKSEMQKIGDAMIETSEEEN